jgi:hypothetical protein
MERSAGENGMWDFQLPQVFFNSLSHVSATRSLQNTTQTSPGTLNPYSSAVAQHCLQNQGKPGTMPGALPLSSPAGTSQRFCGVPAKVWQREVYPGTLRCHTSPFKVQCRSPSTQIELVLCDILTLLPHCSLAALHPGRSNSSNPKIDHKVRHRPRRRRPQLCHPRLSPRCHRGHRLARLQGPPGVERSTHITTRWRAAGIVRGGGLGSPPPSARAGLPPAGPPPHVHPEPDLLLPGCDPHLCA